MAKPSRKPPRLKIRIPLVFEAEGEGLCAIACTAVLSAVVICALFVVGRSF